MKNFIILFFTLIVISGCKSDPKNESTESNTTPVVVAEEIPLKFNVERHFYGMLYNPSSQVYNHFSECDQNQAQSFVISGEGAYDDFIAQFKAKYSDDYLTAEWIKIEFKGYVTETRQKVDKGELYTAVMTELLLMDRDNQCK